MSIRRKGKRDSLRAGNARRGVGTATRKAQTTQAIMQQRRRPSAIIAELTRKMNQVERGQITAETFEELTGLGYFEAVQCWYQYHLANIQWALRSQIPIISERECEAILKGEPLP